MVANEKKLKQQICIYCGREATTRDHVPPKQLFPKPRPTLETVPSCFECNNLFGKDEDYFFASFMFSEAGVSVAGKKLWKEKLHRMYKKNSGLRRKIAQNLKPINLFTPHGIFTGRKILIKIDENRIYKIVRKIIKGLYYIEYKEIMPASQNLDCLFLQTQKKYDTAMNQVSQLKNGSKKWDGICQYKYNRTEKGNPGSMWLINFFDFAIFWVIASNK